MAPENNSMDRRANGFSDSQHGPDGSADPDAEDLRTAFKKRGHFDALRKELFKRLLSSPAHGTLLEALEAITSKELARDPGLRHRDRGKAASLLEGAVERSEAYDNVEKTFSDMIKDERGNIDQMVRKIWKEMGGSELKEESKETKETTLPNGNGNGIHHERHEHHEQEQSEDDMDDVQMDLDSGDEGAGPSILQTNHFNASTKTTEETKEKEVEMEDASASRPEQEQEQHQQKSQTNLPEDKESKEEETKAADPDAMDHEPTHDATVTVNGVTTK